MEAGVLAGLFLRPYTVQPHLLPTFLLPLGFQSALAQRVHVR